MPRWGLTHRPIESSTRQPHRLARHIERPQRFPTTAPSSLAVEHPEQQMLGTDVVVAVSAGLLMGPCDSASRRHAEKHRTRQYATRRTITGFGRES